MLINIVIGALVPIVIVLKNQLHLTSHLSISTSSGINNRILIAADDSALHLAMLVTIQAMHKSLEVVVSLLNLGVPWLLIRVILLQMPAGSLIRLWRHHIILILYFTPQSPETSIHSLTEIVLPVGPGRGLVERGLLVALGRRREGHILVFVDAWQSQSRVMVLIEALDADHVS